jgi:hypothetical protein
MAATRSVTVCFDGVQVVVPCHFTSPGSVAALRAVIEAEFRVPALQQWWRATSGSSGAARVVTPEVPGHLTLAEAGLSAEWSRVAVTRYDPMAASAPAATKRHSASSVNVPSAAPRLAPIVVDLRTPTKGMPPNPLDAMVSGRSALDALRRDFSPVPSEPCAVPVPPAPQQPMSPVAQAAESARRGCDRVEENHEQLRREPLSPRKRVLREVTRNDEVELPTSPRKMHRSPRPGHECASPSPPRRRRDAALRCDRGGSDDDDDGAAALAIARSRIARIEAAMQLRQWRPTPPPAH